MTLYVRMTDSFMSGWGQAANKTNVLQIACETVEQAEQIERAARRRPEMKRVALCLNPVRPRSHVLLTKRHYSDMGGMWVES